MTEKELKDVPDETLIQFILRAGELKGKSSGNGKTPFDEKQLQREALRRMERKAGIPATS